MKTDEYYVKVEIESEADLPERKGLYLVYSKSKNYSRWGFDFSEQDIITWMTYANWYLLPVEQIELPSDEEIEKQADLKFDNWSNKAFWSGGAMWAVDWIKDKMK